MKRSSKYIIASAVACIIVCIGEFVTIFVFGAYYPGYSQMKDTMSKLGSSVSPVSDAMSAWWVIMGILLIFFATGFRKAFSGNGKYSGFAALLIMLYGFGEGIGSGAFKADHVADGLTASAMVHDALGGIGVTAILLFPLLMQKVIPKNEKPVFHRISQIAFIAGILTIVLFLFRYSPDENDILSVYKGLWQRLFMLNTYIYLSLIAIIMIKNRHSTSKGSVTDTSLKSKL
jgi:hypothetical protein